jgi:hypothetical protein
LPTKNKQIKLTAADIAALPENSIAVREKWKEKRLLSQPGTLNAFAPATVAACGKKSPRSCNGAISEVGVTPNPLIWHFV